MECKILPESAESEYTRVARVEGVDDGIAKFAVDDVRPSASGPGSYDVRAVAVFRTPTEALPDGLERDRLFRVTGTDEAAFSVPVNPHMFERSTRVGLQPDSTLELGYGYGRAEGGEVPPARSHVGGSPR